MTNQQDALRAAQEAVRHAREIEGEGNGEAAEEYWREAQRQYEDAGVDPSWFDDADLVARLDETPEPMKLRWIFPTQWIEASFDPEAEEVKGVIVDADDIEDVVP